MTLNPQGWRKTLAIKLEDERRPLLKADDYYMGRQPLRYLDPEVRRQLGGRLENVVVNWPRLVVDAIEERLNVVGIRNGEDTAADLWRIWQANGMDEYSERAHADALVYGRSYAMVWASPDPSVPRISIESPLQMTVERDPYSGEVVAALKQWMDATKRWRALVITPEKVVQFRTDMKSDSAMPPPSNESAWIQFSTEDNPLGVVPVVPIVNRARTMHPDGESELADVFSLADAVNKLCTDLLVSAEYSAMPRRWITGMYPMGNSTTQQQAEDMAEKVRNTWETARGSKIWIAPSEQTKMGQFPEAQLDGFVNSIRLFSMQVAAIAGLPPHYLGLVSDNPASADAIRSAEASLVFKAMRRQRVWSQAWVQVLYLAMQVRDGVPPVGMEDLEIVWENPETRTPGQMADYALKLVQGGIVDRATVLEDLGYTPSKIERLGGYA
jgi:hypothetical protein